jgi:hypothetical protein
MRLTSSLLVVAACGGATPDTTTTTHTTPTTTTTPTPDDCGVVDDRVQPNEDHARAVYRCLVDAHAAGREVSARWIAVSDEGAETFLDLHVMPGPPPIVVIAIDGRGDPFSASPSPQTLQCERLILHDTPTSASVEWGGCR